MTKNPLNVFCPTCLAGIGQPCRSIVSAHQNPEGSRGMVCKPHGSRRAKASGLKLIAPGGEGR